MTAVGTRGLLVSGTVALAALLLALGAVVCNGGGGDDTAEAPVGGAAIPGSGEEFDGCVLVDELEAGEILGGRALPGAKPVEHSAAATCVWERRSGDHPRSLQFSVFRGDDLYGAEGAKDDPTFEEVEGVGEDAFFVEPSGVQLHVLTDEYSVVISVDGFDGDKPLDKEKVKGRLVALAKRVVGSL